MLYNTLVSLWKILADRAVRIKLQAKTHKIGQRPCAGRLATGSANVAKVVLAAGDKFGSMAVPQPIWGFHKWGTPSCHPF